MNGFAYMFPPCRGGAKADDTDTRAGFRRPYRAELIGCAIHRALPYAKTIRPCGAFRLVSTKGQHVFVMPKRKKCIMSPMFFANTAWARKNFIIVAARILSAILFKAAVICIFAVGVVGVARAEIAEGNSGMSVEDAIAEGIACLRKDGWNKNADVLSSIGGGAHDGSESGVVALHHISICGSAGAVMALIKAGADVNIANEDKNTPLHYAAKNYNVAAISVLAKAGADVNAVNGNGGTPIAEAASRLLHCASDRDYRVASDAPNAVSALIDVGADVNKTDNNVLPLDIIYALAFRVKKDGLCGNDILARKQFAALKKLAQILKSAGGTCKKWCNLAAIVEGSGMSIGVAIAEAVICYRKRGWNKTANWLISVEDDIHAADEDGYTVLHHISYCGSADAAMTLIQAGADVNATNKKKDTPLHQAAWEQKAAVISVLVKAGADVNAANEDGHTPIISALSPLVADCESDKFYQRASDSPNAVSSLINFGADVNRTYKDGIHALDFIYASMVDVSKRCGNPDMAVKQYTTLRELAHIFKSAGGVCDEFCWLSDLSL